MILKDTFVNKIRALGYTFKSQHKRIRIWRKTGGSHRIFVPLCKLLEDEYVRSQLNQTCLMTREEIEQFISEYSQPPSLN
jgi:hypothetical protein